MNTLQILSLVVVSVTTAQCNSTDKPADAVEEPVDAGVTKAATLDDEGSLEYKQAKIWARLDTIEQEQSRQKARIKLLEQGLLLGVVPDELRDPSDLEHEKRLKKRSKKDLEKGVAPVTEVKKVDTQTAAIAAVPVVTEKSSDREAFEKDLAAAQELFRGGRYGGSVAAFEAIGNKYKDELTVGLQHYWIGLSWFNLKEYESAQKHLQLLVGKFAASPWVPRSKLYLARIQVRRGLKEQALESLQKVIAEHGNEDAADMARADIETLKANL